MTTETTQTTEQTQATPEAKSISSPNLSYAEYETLRRGGTLPEAAPSALDAKASEQKEAGNSEAQATEENGEAETLDRESEKSDTEAKEEAQSEDKKPKKGGIQKRFDKLTREKIALEQEKEYWRQQALRTSVADKPDETPNANAPKAELSSESGKPDPNNYSSHQEWVEAVADWMADRKLEQKLKEREEKANKEKVMSEQQKIAQTYQEKLAAFKEKTPDFSDVEAELDEALAEAKVGPNTAMTQAFLTADNGPELAYELAKDPKEFVRICKLDPFRAAVELGKFAAKLEAKSSQAKETKKLTNAPKPLEPVGGGKGTSAKKSLDDPDLTFAEYERLRREQMKRRA